MINCFKFFPIYILRQKCLKKARKEKFKPYQIFVLNYFKYFLTYICLKKKLDKKMFELYQIYMCYIVLNIFIYFFKYTFSDIFSKNIRPEKFWTYQVFIHNVLFQNAPILPYITDALKALLSKNWFYYFFLIFCHAKVPSSSRRHATIINTSFNPFLKALRISYLKAHS